MGWELTLFDSEINGYMGKWVFIYRQREREREAQRMVLANLVLYDEAVFGFGIDEIKLTCLDHYY